MVLMSNDILPPPCAKILEWLRGRPADRSISLEIGSATLSELLATVQLGSRRYKADLLRVLDYYQAIEIQAVLVRKKLERFSDLFTPWESPIGSARRWDAIIKRAETERLSDLRIRGGLRKGSSGKFGWSWEDARSYYTRELARLRTEHRSIPEFDDIDRLCATRIRITEKGKALLALQKLQGRTEDFTKGFFAPSDLLPRHGIPKEKLNHIEQALTKQRPRLVAQGHCISLQARARRNQARFYFRESAVQDIILKYLPSR
jgi:hypothetical protein